MRYVILCKRHQIYTMYCRIESNHTAIPWSALVHINFFLKPFNEYAIKHIKIDNQTFLIRHISSRRRLATTRTCNGFILPQLYPPTILRGFPSVAVCSSAKSIKGSDCAVGLILTIKLFLCHITI